LKTAELKIKFKLNYSSNFKILGPKNSHWVFCKKFIGFLYLINFFKNKSKLEKSYVDFWFTNPVFFFKKTKQSLFLINRAPYRYKMARNQLTFSRYFFLFSFNLILPLQNLKFLINSDCSAFVNKFLFFFNSFESNIAFLKTYKIVFFFYKPINLKLN